MKKGFFIFVLSVMAWTLPVRAATLHVGEEETYSSIGEAVQSAFVGDEIVIHGDSYESAQESFPIVLDKEVHIRKSGQEPVTIQCEELKPVFRVTAPGTTIEDINVFFRRYGMYVLDNDITVQNCCFSLEDEKWRETSCGIWIGGAKRMTLTGCRFEDCGIALAGPEVTPGKTGIPVLTALFEVGEDREFFTTHTIENNYVNGKNLVYLVGTEDCTIDEPCGQIIAVECKNVTFDQQDVSGASIGIQAAYGENIRIVNSQANDCGVFGVYLCKSRDCLISHMSADNSAHGVDIRDAERCMVAGCHTTNCGQGIFFSWGRNCITTDCEMVQNGTGFFSASGGGNHINHCIITDNELGLYIQHESFFLTDSQINRNTSCGLRFTDSSAQVYGCSFRDNFVGVLPLSQSVVNITGSSFDGNTENDVYMKDIPEYYLEGNDFAGDPNIYIAGDK